LTNSQIEKFINTAWLFPVEEKIKYMQQNSSYREC